MRVVIHNPAAGGAPHGRELLVRLTRQAGYTPLYFSSNDPAWKRAVSGGTELVVVASGDGTVAHVARQMAGGHVPLVVLPLGTANNIARALGHPAGVPPERSVAGWRNAVRRSFDLGVARGPWGSRVFLESVGAGLLAETFARINGGTASQLHEHPQADVRVAAARSVVREVLEGLQPTRFDVSVDGVDRSGDYLLAETLNFGTAGPNPSADCSGPARATGGAHRTDAGPAVTFTHPVISFAP